MAWLRLCLKSFRGRTCVTDLLTQAQQFGTPLVNGRTATFLWHGPNPPILRGDFNDWSADNPIVWQPAGQANLWRIEREFPADAYIEYAYGLDGDRRADPFNPNRVDNGFGQLNHFFYMPIGQPTPLIHPQADVPAGILSRHHVDTHRLAIHGRRTVYLYQPPTDAPVPLLLVYDGIDYYRRAYLTRIIDNLIAQQRIQPVALALVGNGSEHGRYVEYACSEATVQFINHIVLPLAQQELDLVDINQYPGAYGVMGASMGGLISLFTAFRLPHIFGKVLSQSGAFHLHGYGTVVIDLINYLPPPMLRIWLDVGQFEWLHESNVRVHTLLQEKGYDVAFRPYPAGHNYTAWRNDLAHGLIWLFQQAPITPP